MSIAARWVRSWPIVIRTRRTARRCAATGRRHARAAGSNPGVRQDPSGESRDGNTSTCSKRCSSVSIRTRRRCAYAARQSSIPSVRSRCGCDALSDEAPAEGCHRDGPARARLQSHAGHEHPRREAPHRGDPDVRGAHRRVHRRHQIADGGPRKPPRFQLAIGTTC